MTDQELRIRVIAESVLKNHRREDSRELASATIKMLDLVAMIKKEIALTGHISEARFQSMLRKLEGWAV